MKKSEVASSKKASWRRINQPLWWRDSQTQSLSLWSTLTSFFLSLFAFVVFFFFLFLSLFLLCSPILAKASQAVSPPSNQSHNSCRRIKRQSRDHWKKWEGGILPQLESREMRSHTAKWRNLVFRFGGYSRLNIISVFLWCPISG